MSLSIREDMALVSVSDIDSINRIDAKALSSKADEYVKFNRLSCYILTNTWLMAIRGWSAYGWMYVRQAILNDGLMDVIRRAQTAAQEIVDGFVVTDPVFRMVNKDVQNNFSVKGVPTSSDTEIGKEPTATALFLFRYPKRYSPQKADKLYEAAIHDFQNGQNRLKLLQRREIPHRIISAIRDVMYSLIDWSSMTVELSSLTPQDIVFTPGVGFDSKAQLQSKLAAISSSHCEYFYQPFGIPLVCHRPFLGAGEWGPGFENSRYSFKMREDLRMTSAFRDEIRPVRLTPVPKNYKAARVIAPEDTYRQAMARKMFDIIDHYLPANLPLHDQTVNQRFAQAGSVWGFYSTLDLHAASDSISKTLFEQIFPSSFKCLVRSYLPTHYEAPNGKLYTMQACATMGNSLTFILESIVFYAVVEAACRYQDLFEEDMHRPVYVYGDDIIVDSRYVDITIDWLSKCGFIVNTEKSYSGDHPYRESCGAEFILGYDVASLYFPRFPIEGSLSKAPTLSRRARRDGHTGIVVDSLAATIQLQHKLFFVCQEASIFLAELVREAFPKMTTSTPDEELSDLWSYESTPIWKMRRARKGTPEDPRFMLPYHYTPVAKYPKASVTPEMEAYYYMRYLQFGPLFTDPFLKLLRCSESRFTPGSDSNPPEMEWVLLAK